MAQIGYLSLLLYNSEKIVCGIAVYLVSVCKAKTFRETFCCLYT